jgi:hypothetical protein
MTDEAPFVTVVVATRDRPDVVRYCLGSLAFQRFKDLEVKMRTAEIESRWSEAYVPFEKNPAETVPWWSHSVLPLDESVKIDRGRSSRHIFMGCHSVGKAFTSATILEQVLMRA